MCGAHNWALLDDAFCVQAGQPLSHAPSSYVTALLVPAGGAIDLDRPALEAMGIRSAPCLQV